MKKKFDIYKFFESEEFIEIAAIIAIIYINAVFIYSIVEKIESMYIIGIILIPIDIYTVGKLLYTLIKKLRK